jgi:hypothetical protein
VVIVELPVVLAVEVGVVVAVDVPVVDGVLTTQSAKLPSWCHSIARLSIATPLQSELKSFTNPDGVQPNITPDNSPRVTSETTAVSAAAATEHCPSDTAMAAAPAEKASLQTKSNAAAVQVETT